MKPIQSRCKLSKSRDRLVNSTKHPKSQHADRLVLSKGHAAPVLYAAYALAGQFEVSKLSTLRKIDSVLEGHPTPRLDFVDVATGSLGQGLGCAAGMAWAGKYLDKLPYKVFCILGDGECAEGSVWEAMAFAAHYSLDNLVCIIDCNELGQSEAVMTDAEEYGRRAGSYGWHTRIIQNGNEIRELREALRASVTSTVKKPFCIVMRTKKGAHMYGISGNDGWHGRPLKEDEAKKVIEKLKYLAYEGDIVTERKDVDFPADDNQPLCPDLGNDALKRESLTSSICSFIGCCFATLICL
ncbi:hypothetical protein ACOME3_006716 [Neoechinorhynchus agilis]